MAAKVKASRRSVCRQSFVLKPKHSRIRAADVLSRFWFIVLVLIQSGSPDQQNPAGRTRLCLSGSSRPVRTCNININICLCLVWTKWFYPDVDQNKFWTNINRVRPSAWRSDSLPVFKSFFHRTLNKNSWWISLIRSGSHQLHRSSRTLDLGLLSPSEGSGWTGPSQTTGSVSSGLKD